MSGGAIAVLAALALAEASACASRPMRDDAAADIARAIRTAAAEQSLTGVPSALPPAILEIVHPATPLRGANGLACVDRRVAVAEALGNRVALVSAGGGMEVLELPSGLQAPDDLLLDGDGSLLVTALVSGEVWRRGVRGGWSKVAGGLPGVNGIAQDATGRLFVSTCTHAKDDGVFEIDPAGTTPPRTIAGDLGCPGAMVADADALLVPTSDTGSVLRVRVADGSTTTVASGLRAPTTVSRAPDGTVVVLEAATGLIRSLGRGDPADGPGDVVAQLDAGLDGFAICGESALVSNFVTGALVAYKPWPTAARMIEPAGLAAPHGLAVRGEDLLVSDGVSIRRLHEGSASVLVATVIDPIPPPFALALAPGGVAWITVPHFGEVHRVDLVARTSEKVTGGLDWPTSVLAAPDGRIFVADTGAGRIVEIGPDGDGRVIASGLVEPLALALRGGQLLTTEPEGGRLLGFRDGSPPALIASGLAEPVGIATDSRGRVYVAEGRTGSLIRVDTDGSRTRVAQGFDFRHARARRSPIPMIVDAAGALLVALPDDGSVVRVLP